LLNAVLGVKELARTGKRPGKTRVMCGYLVGGSPTPGEVKGAGVMVREGRTVGGGKGKKGEEEQLVILDMPGYGYGSQQEWGKEIVKYLVKRQQ
jgi:GTP-binding protein